MANTFKVITKAGVTSADVIYTVAGSTTAIVLGFQIGNTTGSAITTTVTLTSDTGSRAGANNEANQTVEILTATAIPANDTLAVLSGAKLVLEATDSLTVTGSAAVDITISVMEIT
jgi:hypothetical protein|tara:strand:+ start:566 stop:913 length:348 start_codon:yes stop_codon:yes gene_type:complete